MHISFNFVFSALAIASSVLAAADTGVPATNEASLAKKHWRTHRLAKHFGKSRNNLTDAEKAQWAKMRAAWKAKHQGQSGSSDCDDQKKEQSNNAQPVAIAKPTASLPSKQANVVKPITKSKTIRTRTRTTAAVQTKTVVPSPKPTTSKVSVAPITTSSAAPVSPPATGVSGDAAAILKAHNDYRAKHGANPLVWDDKLAAAAQAWTDRCVYEHGGGKAVNGGENIAAGYRSITDAFVAWGPDEEADYNPAAPTYSHFTQIVWKATTKLGCGISACPTLKNAGSGPFYSCVYGPPGNVYGPNGSTEYFDKNVQK